MTVSELVKNGVITHQQSIILSCLREGGAKTNREISSECLLPINVVTPRNSELRRMGYVKYSHKKYDAGTNRTVRAWDAV